MRVLIVKTSSLGDVIHALPALSDAAARFPDLHFDWLVEESYSEIPRWHPAVAEVIPVNFRHWRKHPWQAWRGGTWQEFKHLLGKRYYDCIIDAQGLLKSAFLAAQAHGERCGLDWLSAREPLASLFYQKRFKIAKNQHAVTRTRQLFATAFDYPEPATPPDYGLKNYPFTTLMPSRPTLLFLHGTNWPSKRWPLEYWQQLAKIAALAGFRVRLPWGSEEECRRAHAIANGHPQISVMPPSNLQALAAELSTAAGVVGVDTGLAHLAAALNVPAVTIYGSTRAAITGTFGQDQVHLSADFACSPCLHRVCRYHQPSTVTPACYSETAPHQVWQSLLALLGQTRRGMIALALLGRGKNSSAEP
jgi:heptosyltransferase-1